MHLQFLRGGEAGDDVEYAVERVFDGRTASARRVVSRQAGRVITAASVSFSLPLAVAVRPQDDGVSHVGAHYGVARITA
jgi:acyl-CoA thioesterase